MVSKLELLIRVICKNNSIILINVHDDGRSSVISLESIFKKDEFKDLISEEDYNFLKYVLIEPGLNLRNKSSHALDLNIYNFQNANLILLSFFKLIKYL